VAWDINQVTEAMRIAVLAQIDEIKDQMAREQGMIPAGLRGQGSSILPLRLTQCVSHNCLVLLHKEHSKAKKAIYAMKYGHTFSVTNCTGFTTATFGVPCSHFIQNELDKDPHWKVTGDLIDPFWFYERPVHPGPFLTPIDSGLPPVGEPRLPPLPPRTVRASGRPRADNLDLTTRRQPSWWEIRRNTQASYPGPSQNAVIDGTHPVPFNRAPGSTGGPLGRPEGSMTKITKDQLASENEELKCRNRELERILNLTIQASVASSLLSSTGGDGVLE
jgi:hypothetical protein